VVEAVAPKWHAARAAGGGAARAGGVTRGGDDGRAPAGCACGGRLDGRDGGEAGTRRVCGGVVSTIPIAMAHGHRVPRQAHPKRPSPRGAPGTDWARSLRCVYSPPVAARAVVTSRGELRARVHPSACALTSLLPRWAEGGCRLSSPKAPQVSASRAKVPTTSSRPLLGAAGSRGDRGATGRRSATLPRPELRPQIHGGAPRAEAPNAARPRSREASGPVPRVSPRARRGEGTAVTVVLAAEDAAARSRRQPTRGACKSVSATPQTPTPADHSAGAFVALSGRGGSRTRRRHEAEPPRHPLLYDGRPLRWAACFRNAARLRRYARACNSARRAYHPPHPSASACPSASQT